MHLRVRGVQQTGRIGDRVAFRNSAQFQSKSDVRRLAGAYARRGAGGAEPPRLYLQFVIADAELVEGESPAVIGFLNARLSGFQAGESDFGLRHRAAGRVGDNSFHIAGDLGRQSSAGDEKQS